MNSLPKRIICVVLLLLLFCLTSCSADLILTEKQPDHTTQQTVQTSQTPTRPDKPIESEMHMLQQYHDIVEFLYEYNGPRHEWVYIDFQIYSDQRALNACRNWLLEHPEVDIWEDWMPTYFSDDYNWNRLELLDKFTALEDVPIRDDVTDYSPDGEQRYVRTLSEYSYDFEGRLIRRTNINEIWEMYDQDASDNHYHACYVYDENGILQQIIDARFLNESYITIQNACYNEQGVLTGFLYECDYGTAEIKYAYDDEGRIVFIHAPVYPGSKNYVEVEYFYDVMGNMIREEKRVYQSGIAHPKDSFIMTKKTVTDYTYDENGLLCSGAKTIGTWDYGDYYDEITQEYSYGNYLKNQEVDTYTFEFDTQGRLLSVLVEYGDTYHMSGSNEGEVSGKPINRFRLIEVIYGTYWLYNGM